MLRRQNIAIDCLNNYPILRGLPLLSFFVYLYLLYSICCCYIYNIFWWSDPIQDVIANSFTFTTSTSSFVYFFSTPHIYWLWRQRIASGFYFSWITYYIIEIVKVDCFIPPDQIDNIMHFSPLYVFVMVIFYFKMTGICVYY